MRQKSHIKVDKMQKIRSHESANVQKMSPHESSFPWTVGFMIRQKSHIQVHKLQKMSSHEATNPRKREFGPFLQWHPLYRSLNHYSIIFSTLYTLFLF